MSVENDPRGRTPAERLEDMGEPVSLLEVLAYEVHSAWWLSYVSADWLQEIAAKWIARKTGRKYARYLSAFKAHKQRLLKLALQNPPNPNAMPASACESAVKDAP